jgi:hypothetical protein
MAGKITQKNNEVKYCIKCGIELTDENQQPHRKKAGHYICRICVNKIKNDSYRDHLKDGIVYKCRICNVILNEETWGKHKRFQKNLICKKCSNTQLRKWWRTTYIGTNDKNGNHITLKTHKRPYPIDGCEICHKITKLDYHHWDDNNPHWGLWLDHGCHMAVELLEKGIDINRYWILKEKVMRKWKYL